MPISCRGVLLIIFFSPVPYIVEPSGDGGGSLFEIKLEKDVEIPCKYIHSIEPDGYYRYDVKDVYGVVDSFWTGTVKVA